MQGTSMSAKHVTWSTGIRNLREKATLELRRPDFEKAYAQATKLRREGSNTDAIEQYAKVIDMLSDGRPLTQRMTEVKAVAHIYIGNILKATGDFKGSADRYTLAKSIWDKSIKYIF